MNYPLWCIDRGTMDEAQYAGPFKTEAEARSRMSERGDTGWKVRRCRRAKLSDLHSSAYIESAVEMMLENLDEDIEPVHPDVWGDFEDQIVMPSEKTEEAIAALLEALVEVRAYICEGDE